MTRKELEALASCSNEIEHGRELDCRYCAASQNCGSVACSAEPGELAALALRLADALQAYDDAIATGDYLPVAVVASARALLAELEKES